MSMLISFPGLEPIPTTSKLVFVNLGVLDGVAKLAMVGNLTVPTPAAVVSTVSIERIDQGRFGTKAVVSIPKIAGGAGAITRLNLKIRRVLKRNGPDQSFLLARCFDHRFVAHVTLQFVDGTRASETVTQPCVKSG